MNEVWPASYTTSAVADHGGGIAAARRRWPEAPARFVDLSTGINPVPYPLPAIPSDALTRLPEPEDEAALRIAACAAYLISDDAMVAAAPGTQILINLIPRLFPYAKVRILGPTYAEHALRWRAAGAEVREVVDVAKLADGGAAVVVNPNNPDGRHIDAAALGRLADRLAAKGGLLVVDEAFADLDGRKSAVSLLPRPGLLVLRSFGKTHGLAGLRLGFALAAPDRAAVIRDALGPWAVSGPAIVAAVPALHDGAWRADARRRLERDTARLDGMLAESGMRVAGGTPLFRLAVADDAARRFDRLGRAGILVRAFADHPTWLRFGIPGSRTAWDRVARVLQDMR